MSTNERIRGRRLQEIRARHFAQFPLCVRCQAKQPPRLTIATQLDHVVALGNGGTDTSDNRQGLCDECHDEKTAADFDREYRPKPTIGIDGWPIDAAQRTRQR